MMVEFTPEENTEFIRLLKKIQENEYWVPTTDAWLEVQRTFSRWATELVIIDKNDKHEPTILLSRYAGESIPTHQGYFHIPGGFERSPESIQETCSRIAKSELGIDVEYKKVLDIHKWTVEESPNKSRILSIFVLCEPASRIMENKEKRFFTRKEILALGPQEMIQNHPHCAFASSYLARLTLT